jgi:thiamine biosynthesis lipoprotein
MPDGYSEMITARLEDYCCLAGRGSRLICGMKWVRCPCLLIVLALLAVSCVSAHEDAPSPGRYEFHQTEMGVPFRIVLYALSQNSAEGAAAAAFQRVKQLNDIMTDYDSDSELSRLSQTSGQHQAVAVSPDLWVVLARAQELAQRSQGAFDVTVGPYVNLWRFARSQGKPPDPARLAKARLAVGYAKMQLDARTTTLSNCWLRICGWIWAGSPKVTRSIRRSSA